MPKNVPRKRKCPGADTLGTSKTGRQTTSATNAHSNSTTKKRTPATRPQDPPYDFSDILDLTGALSAEAANKLAHISRLLAQHDREIGGLGADVARVASMATTALEAALLIHQVQGEYQDWQVA